MKNLLHHSQISLPEKDRVELIAMMNKTLASTSDLYAQLKQAHWNIKGEQFIAVHLLLDTIAEQVEEQVDIVAERIMALGGSAMGTLQEAVKNTQLRLYPTDIFMIKDHIEHLTHNMAILGELSRKNIKESEKYADMVTSDMYIALTTMLDKNLWFLEAHIQK